MIERDQYDAKDLAAMDEILDSIVDCTFGQVFDDGLALAAAVRLPEGLQVEIQKHMLQRFSVKDRGFRALTKTELDRKFRAARTAAHREDAARGKAAAPDKPASVMDSMKNAQLTETERELAAVVDAVIVEYDVFGVMERVAVLATDDIRPAVWMICRNALRKAFRRDLNLPTFDKQATAARKRASERAATVLSARDAQIMAEMEEGVRECG